MHSLQTAIGFIGAGNMAEALIRGICRQKDFQAKILAFDPDRAKLRKLKSKFKVEPVLDNSLLVRRAMVILLAVKPQELKSVLQEISSLLTPKHRIVSIVAGVDLDSLRQLVPPACKIIRTMPNQPALIGEGITALFSSAPLSVKEKKLIENLFKGSGETVWVGKEKELDAVTGLSGSGPAYVYQFISSLAKAGEKMGLPASIAYRLALKTTLGAARTLEETQEDPIRMIAKVASKGGTTLAGLEVLQKGKFDFLLEKTVRAATKRAGELRQQFKRP